MTSDTQYVGLRLDIKCRIDIRLQIAGAIAVVKHFIKLVVLIVALATCIAVYCFLLIWLCLLWFQTRLFRVTAAFLRSSMNVPHLAQLDAGDAQHQPDTLAVKDQEGEVMSAHDAETSQKPMTSKSYMTLEDLQNRFNAPKGPSRPQVPEEWRVPGVEGVSETFKGEDWTGGEHGSMATAAPGEEIAEQEQERVRWHPLGDDQDRAVN